MFNDLNHDGSQGPGENGIGGVTVELLDSHGTVIASTTTAADGTFAFPNLAPGMYSVRETDPPGYISTTPNLVAVTLPASGSVSVAFGDVQPPDLRIQKSLQGALTTGPQGGTYLIDVANVGNGPTVGPITVTDPMPTGMILVSASGAGWNCATSTADEMTCVRTTTLGPHQSAPAITLRVTVQPNLRGEILSNVATVSTAFDASPENDSGTSEALVIRAALAPALSARGIAALFVMLLVVAALGVRRLAASMRRD